MSFEIASLRLMVPVRFLALVSFATVACSGQSSSGQAAFEKGNPSAVIVRIPRANHYVYLSNEAEVLRVMREFISSLP
jgi:non-heme chloroperoxidase